SEPWQALRLSREKSARRSATQCTRRDSSPQEGRRSPLSGGACPSPARRVLTPVRPPTMRPAPEIDEYTEIVRVGRGSPVFSGAVAWIHVAGLAACRVGSGEASSSLPSWLYSSGPPSSSAAHF